MLAYQARQDEIDAAWRRVLLSGRYVLGEEVAAFEAEFAAFLGVPFACGVASGTDALHLALWACDVGPGDEVITVSHTAVATVSAIRLRGAIPVFVDVDSQTMTMDPALVAPAITAHTRAILPVHLYGHPVDLDPILVLARRSGLRVVEDCAQSLGALYKGRRAGACGDIACFSFYPTKNIGAIGDGGMIVTGDGALAERISLLRQYGWRQRYVSEVEGTNSRLDELQAAILRVKLRYLDDDNARRRALADTYRHLLEGTPLHLPETAAWADHCFHQFVVRTKRRDDLAAFLRARGIGTLVHYPVPVHLQPAYAQLASMAQAPAAIAEHRPSSPTSSGRAGRHLRQAAAAKLPQTERAAAEVLSLPMYPELTSDQLGAIAQAIVSWAAGEGSTHNRQSGL